MSEFDYIQCQNQGGTIRWPFRRSWRSRLFCDCVWTNTGRRDGRIYWNAQSIPGWNWSPAWMFPILVPDYGIAQKIMPHIWRLTSRYLYFRTWSWESLRLRLEWKSRDPTARTKSFGAYSFLITRVQKTSGIEPKSSWIFLRKME